LAGPYQQELTALSELMDWLWTEHGKSFVKAGDDKVYAFGGDGYVLVFDESKWSGSIELITPKGAITIKPGENGKLAIDAPNLDEKSIREILTTGTDGLRRYYEKRYWNTPG
jgi:hypothetical protein